MFEKAKTVLRAAKAAAKTHNVWNIGAGGMFSSSANLKDQLNQLEAFAGDIYNFVDYRAESISQMEGKIHYLKNGEEEEVEEHPFYELLKHPNQVHTQADILYLVECHLGLVGNAYWYTPINNHKMPGEILPLLPPYVKIVPGEGTGVITGYIYERGGKKIPLDVDEVVHFRLPNPLDPYYYGMSPIAAEQAQIASLNAIEKYKQAVFENMGSPSLFAKLKQEYIGHLKDKKKRDEFAEEFRAMYQGYKNAGGVVMHAAIDDLKAMTGEKELSYLKSEEAGRKKLANTYKVPLGLMFDQTGALGRSAIESEYYRLHKDGIMPRAKRIAGTITKDLLPLYDEGLWYEFEDTTPQDKEFELQREESRLRTFVWTPNYVREQDGLNPEGWGEKPLAPFNIAPLSTEPRGGIQENAAPAVGATVGESVGGTISKKEMVEDAGDVEPPKLRRLPELTDELRQRYWNAFTRSADKAEDIWESDLIKEIKEHERTVLKNLKNLYGKGYSYERKGVEDFIMISEETAKVGFWKGSERGVRQSIDSGVSLAEAKIGIPGIIDNPDVHFAEHIRAKELKIKSVPAVEYHSSIRSAIHIGVEQGKSYEEMREVIQQAFSGYTDRVEDWKVDRIVRTEVTETVNYAQLEAAKESDVVSHKVWLSEMDADVRDTHGMAHGQERKLDEPFEVGGHAAMYPGEGTLPPEESINCRCDEMFARYEEVNE